MNCEDCGNYSNQDRCPGDCDPELISESFSNAGLYGLSLEISSINKANGWDITKPEEWEDDYKIPGIIALVHSEASEALEAFRENDKDNFAEELADIVIRVLDLSAGFGIDMDSEIAKKLEKNKKRGYKHGGKRV